MYIYLYKKLKLIKNSNQKVALQKKKKEFRNQKLKQNKAYL